MRSPAQGWADAATGCADQAGSGDERVIRDEQRGHCRGRDCGREAEDAGAFAPLRAHAQGVQHAGRRLQPLGLIGIEGHVDRPGVPVLDLRSGVARDPRHELVVETEAFDR